MWFYIPDDRWDESWEDTLQREWQPLEQPDTEGPVWTVEVITTHWWLFMHLPYDQVWRPHPHLESVSYRRDSIDGRALDQVRFSCPYDYATVVAVIRELVDLGIVPTDRWSLVLSRMVG